MQGARAVVQQRSKQSSGLSRGLLPRAEATPGASSQVRHSASGLEAGASIHRARSLRSMASPGKTKLTQRPAMASALRYGLAFGSVAAAVLLELVFRAFKLPDPFAAFALSAMAITFWYAGTKPGIVAALLSSLIRGYIFDADTSSLSRVLYDSVFLTFTLLHDSAKTEQRCSRSQCRGPNCKADCRE